MCEIASAVAAELLRHMGPYPPLRDDQLIRVQGQMCGHKKKFSNKSVAKEYAKKLLRRGMPPQHVYECPFCHWCHTSTHRGHCESYDCLRNRVLTTLAL